MEVPRLNEVHKKLTKMKLPPLDPENNSLLGNLHTMEARKLEERLRKEYEELTSELLV